ncbi:Gfo/Idh/MocA family oxidoreductase [Bacillus sp. FJAT-49705]|uniref:Gfo/Idh/MocA family oxidoreductase n=1 Tax=Cytobacillus citreus TaxID=2833586 RepID=A0ABS5NQT2_9BACI|nr:Gfo/Idh/MocA family oxidoreductase [Cytobacillus citreus]MBS4190180.1 Gfo/Idh/MocA family oxidoreductase [Cytobacillus citreus]
MRIGLIGLDTSHSEIFTRLLNDPKDLHYVAGATITHALPVFSEDLPISKDRFQHYKEIVENKYKVKIVEDVEMFMHNVDAVLLATVDGRNHLSWLKNIIHHQKPIFIDKPIVMSSAEMENVMDLSAKHRTPIMSSSSLRYAESIKNINARDFVSGYIYGPLPQQDAMPGYFWYGIHLIEMIVALFGTDISTIQKEKYAGKYEMLKLSFSDGRQVMVRGDYEWHDRFGGVIHYHNRVETFQLWKDERPYYANLLVEIVNFFETCLSPVSLEETAAIIKLIEQINGLDEFGV